MMPAGDTLEASCYQTVLRLARQNADEIDRRYPKIMRRVGGYNLDEFTAPEKPVNLARIMVGSEGTLGVVLEAKLRLVPLPKAKAVMVVMFADLLESLAAAPVILRHNPSAVEVMDKSILDHTRQNAEPGPHSEYVHRGDPAATLMRRVLRGSQGRPAAARCEPSKKICARARLGYAYRAETDLAGQARVWSLREASLGLSMAMKEDAKSHRIRRGHGGGARAPARLH